MTCDISTKKLSKDDFAIVNDSEKYYLGINVLLEDPLERIQYFDFWRGKILKNQKIAELLEKRVKELHEILDSKEDIEFGFDYTLTELEKELRLLEKLKKQSQ